MLKARLMYREALSEQQKKGVCVGGHTLLIKGRKRMKTGSGLFLTSSLFRKELFGWSSYTWSGRGVVWVFTYLCACVCGGSVSMDTECEWGLDSFLRKKDGSELSVVPRL